MFSDKSDGSDKSEILLREQLVGRVGLVRLVRDPIKLLQPQEAAEHSPLWGEMEGAFLFSHLFLKKNPYFCKVGGQ